MMKVMRGRHCLCLSPSPSPSPSSPLRALRALAAFASSSDASSSSSSASRAWLAHLWSQDITRWKQQAPPPRLRGNHAAVAMPTHSKEEVPHTPLDVQRNLHSLLSRDNLVVARDIEWANVLFAFEQESRYLIMDASSPHSPLAHIREASNLIFRQLLRTRRPFVAHITDSLGNEIFRVRRPFWLINSTIYAELDGKEIGVVHRRWHLWRRIYDLYLGNRQFAVVENPGFWNWTFTLKDEDDNVLAQIDRNWRGIGLELFTDAGQYVIRFGGSVSGSYDGSDYNIDKLDVARPLTLPERAIVLALAVSLDCDYFSRRGGWGLPIMVLEE